MTGSENEDIEQEVYIRTWKNLDKYKENGKFKSWINTITANLCRDYMKSSYFRYSQNTVTEEDDLIQIRDEKDFARHFGDVDVGSVRRLCAVPGRRRTDFRSAHRSQTGRICHPFSRT